MKKEILINNIITGIASKINGLGITVNHNDKMRGIQSLSTACTCNKYCKLYSSNPDMVCYHCYSEAMTKRYSNLNNMLEKNTEILTSSILPVEQLPILSCLFFRFEAFGDLQNEVQFINYLNICKLNKYTRFAIWTKNPSIIDRVFKQGYKKPTNLQIVLSSHKMNTISPVAEKYAFIDKVFTVYNMEGLKANPNIKINCGAKNCLLCGKCYTKQQGVQYINELLKSEQKKVKSL